MWVTDNCTPEFAAEAQRQSAAVAAEAHRQSSAVAASEHSVDEQAFIDALGVDVLA